VFVKPLFEATREQMDSLGEEMSRMQDMAKEALPAVKQGDVAEVVSKTGAIAETVVADSAVLAASVAGQLGEGVMKIERYWWKHGLLGALERAVEKIEETRERAQAVLIQRWQARGPVIASDKERLAPAEPQSPAREEEPSEHKAKGVIAASPPANEPTAEKSEQEEERKTSPGGAPASSEPEPFASSALRRRRKSRRDDLEDDSAATASSTAIHSAEEKRAASSSEMLGAPAKPVTPVPSAKADRPSAAAASQPKSSEGGSAASSASAESTLSKWHKYVQAALSKASASSPTEQKQTQTKGRDSVEERKQPASS
jgi:hypothetical protein